MHFMHVPDRPVTLTADQVKSLAVELSELRHDVNNYLSLIVAAAEIIHQRPEMISEVMGTLFEQPQKISQKILTFSEAVEQLLGIHRHQTGA
ncbi:MAG: hypothetical protein FJ387_19615 [Verrucomicrobia bacterium]|nr:hypothetical protein [Verrucomicrobiota bacterium]